MVALLGRKQPVVSLRLPSRVRWRQEHILHLRNAVSKYAFSSQYRIATVAALVQSWPMRGTAATELREYQLMP